MIPGSDGPGQARPDANAVEIADSILSRTTEPLIVCQCPDRTSHDTRAWLWVFHENPK